MVRLAPQSGYPLTTAGEIVAGHGRYEAAKLLGMTKVSVICIDHLGQQQTRVEGQIIKRDWLHHYDERPAEFDLKVASRDTASTQNEHSDWSVGMVWEVNSSVALRAES